jgi:hypothetical protein
MRRALPLSVYPALAAHLGFLHYLGATKQPLPIAMKILLAVSAAGSLWFFTYVTWAMKGHGPWRWGFPIVLAPVYVFSVYALFWLTP